MYMLYTATMPFQAELQTQFARRSCYLKQLPQAPFTLPVRPPCSFSLPASCAPYLCQKLMFFCGPDGWLFCLSLLIPIFFVLLSFAVVSPGVPPWCGGACSRSPIGVG
jgi:hypothetical protein